jgi:ATP-dependent Zn protease
MKRALDEACFILKRRRAVLDTGARLLLEKETLTAETVQALAAEETAAIA